MRLAKQAHDHLQRQLARSHRETRVTLVTYEIDHAGDAVKLTMIESHERPLSDDILSGGRQGWPAILSGLKSVLETGEALSIQMAPPQRMLEALKEMGIKTP